MLRDRKQNDQLVEAVLPSIDEGSKLSVSAKNGSYFCQLPTFCSTAPSRQLAGRKRPRISNEEAGSEDEMSFLVAAELNKLSFQERETVYEDVHAIATSNYQNQMSDEEMQRLINETREHIATIRRSKQAYNRAAFLNVDYVDSDEFLSLFVVEQKFRSLNAAKKVVDHFAIKAELFAPHLLAKKITLQDLDEEDQRSLRTGAFQPLGKDKAGRTVVFGTPCHAYKHVDNQLRAMWYLMMKLAEDPSNKKNGIVLIYYLSSTFAIDNLHVDFYYKTSMIQKAVPFLAKGFHFCYDQEFFRPIMSAMQVAIGNQMRLRFRAHHGSITEVQYALQTFGISGALMPIRRNGSLSTENLQDYLVRVSQDERKEEVQNGDRILCPTSVDVLLGRGRHPQEHIGNLNLAKLVDQHTGTYTSVRKQDKRGLHISIVQSVHAQGGRFLKRGSGGQGWVVVDADIAYDKVRNRFREALSKQKVKA